MYFWMCLYLFKKCKMNIGKYFGYICKVFIYNVNVDDMG